MTNVVLFGAGASRALGEVHWYDDRKTPPLGWELFDELRETYPRVWGSLPPQYSAAFESGDFELGMVEILGTQDVNVVPLFQSMARYFLGFHQCHEFHDAYYLLLEALRDRRALSHTVLSTLNYECLLECAASNLGLVLNMDSHSSEPGTVSIFKLHGSCNLVLDKPMLPGIAHTSGVTQDGSVHYLSPSEAVEWIEENRNHPAMCMYAPGKHSPVGPTHVQNTQRELSRLIADAENVVVIGVRPVLGDEHIWGPLAAAAGSLVLCWLAVAV